QGLFSGFISNAQALIASQTPRKHSGKALGTLVTGSTSGMLMGPIIGGVLAQFFSIRDTFFITASLLALAGILSATLVKEYFVPIKREKNSEEHRGLLSQLQNPRLIIVLLISTMMVQLGNISIAPIISLYIKELMHNQSSLVLVVVVISSFPGIFNII